jgi:hypothetical protein
VNVVHGVLAWEDPPPVKRQVNAPGFDGPTVGAQLRERPGVWALVAINPANGGLATLISSGLRAWCRPSGSFQAAHRTDDVGRKLIYARYVGDPE